MAQRIQLPDGRFAQFPDNMPGSEIEAVLARQFPPAGGATAQPPAEEATEDPGFFERLGNKFEGRKEDFNTIVDAFQETQQEISDDFQADANILPKPVRALGTGAVDLATVVGKVGFGLLVDIGEEVVTTIAGGAFDVLQGIDRATSTGEERTRRGAALGQEFEKIAGTDIVQAATRAAGQGVEAYQEWANDNARAARLVDGIANVGLVLAPVKGRPPSPTLAGRAAEALGASTEKKVAGRRSDFVTDLVRPRGSKKVREEEALRTTDPQGLLGRQTVTPSSGEQAMATAVNEVAAVKSGNTVTQNLNAIDQAVSVENKAIMGQLEKSAVEIPRETISKSMDDVLVGLRENPLLVGDAAKTGMKTTAKARHFLGQNPNTPAGVEKSRQQFDAWLKRQRPKIFDTATDNALSIAKRDTRDAMNALVDASVPDIAVSASRLKQTNLLRALDNIGPKAADEAATNLGRLQQNIVKVLGLKRNVIENIPQIAVALAATGTSFVAPTAALAGVGATAAVVGGAKALTSVTARKSARRLLSLTDRAIKKVRGKKNKRVLQQLRADRAAVVELLGSDE